MKRTYTVSLHQTPFIIEEDGYHVLDQYLSSVHKRFNTIDGGMDILQDIEARIAEQLTETHSTVITLQHVETVMRSMGSVDELETTEQSTSSTPRKLYRDPNDVYVSGVSAGLGAYLGVDPVWIRLSWIVLFFVSMGLISLAYIALWILVPLAKSPTQRLEMQGTPVTLETLSSSIPKDTAKQISRGVGTIKGHISHIVHTYIRPLFWPIRQLVQSMRTLMQRIIFPGIRIGSALVLGGCAVFTIIGITILLPALLGLPVEHIIGFTPTDIISPVLFYTLAICGYVLVFLPAIIVLLFAIGLFRKHYGFPKAVVVSAMSLWLVVLAFTAYVLPKAFFQAQEYAYVHFATTTQVLPVSDTAIKNIMVQNGEGIRVQVVQGEEIQITAQGRKPFIEQVELDTQEGILIIKKKENSPFCWICQQGMVTFTVTVPTLEKIDAKHGTRVDLDTWTQIQPLHLAASNRGRIWGKLDVQELSLHTENGGFISLEGTSTHTTYTAQNAGSIAAKKLTTTTARAEATNGGNIGLQVLDALYATAHSTGNIYYEGTPTTVEIENTSGGQIHQQEQITSNESHIDNKEE